MSVEIKMPTMGLALQTATVGEWLKNEGDTVQKGEVIVEIMTDKLMNALEAPSDGVLLKIACPEGAKVAASVILGYIEQTEEKPENDQP